jgi:23S rRNA-/tRNA-specific pseudouridylate synthase
MVATFDGETAAAAQACLSKENATKTYIAVVRGETPAGTFESRRPLKDQDKKNAPSREAHSIFETVATFPIEITEPFLPDLASSSSSFSSSSDTESNDVDRETPALTTFTRNLTVSVIKVTIKTGRRHQIR